MRYRTISLIALLLVFATLARAEEKTDPRENLDTAILEATKQLENKKYEKFITDFMSPEDRKLIPDDKLPEIAKIVEKNSAEMLTELKAIQSMKPELEADGTKAIYRNIKIEGGTSSMGWIKVGKYWYISGKDTKAKKVLPRESTKP